MSKKKGKGLYRLIFIAQLISIIVIAIALYYIYIWYTDNKNTDKILENIYSKVDILSEDVMDKGMGNRYKLSCCANK